MARWVKSLLAALMVSFLVVGCGAGGNQKMAGTSASPAASPMAAEQGAMAGGDQAPASDSATSADAPQSDRKIILNAEVHIKVKDVEEAIGGLRSLASNSGGYVAHTQLSGQKTSGRRGEITMRIPSGQYEPVMQRLMEFGEVRDARDWTEDVTDQFLDLQPRIAAKEKHLEQLMALYDRGGSTEELMRLTTEIDRVQGEVDSMKGRLQYLSNQVAFSTITAQLYEDGTPMPPPPPKNVWERSVRSFKTSVSGLIEFLGDLVVLSAGLLPQIVFWGALVLITIAVLRVVRTRRKDPPAPPTP